MEFIECLTFMEFLKFMNGIGECLSKVYEPVTIIVSTVGISVFFSISYDRSIFVFFGKFHLGLLHHFAIFPHLSVLTLPGICDHAYYDRQVIYKRKVAKSVFTWNLMPVPVELIP